MKKENKKLELNIENLEYDDSIKKIIKECYILYQLQYLVELKLISQKTYKQIKDEILK